MEEYEIRKRKSEKQWLRVSDYPPSVAHTYRKIFLATRSNGPCIYEYTGYKTSMGLFTIKTLPNKPVKSLTFSNDSNLKRNYYKVGDKILCGEMEEFRLNMLFPELANSRKKEANWSDVLWLFLNEGESEMYKYCWVIKSIQPNGRGGGTIMMSGLIYFEEYNVELKTVKHWSREQLDDNFSQHKNYTAFKFMAKAVASISIIALQGASKGTTASVKALATNIMKKQLRKKASKRFKAMVSKAVLKTAASSTLEFFKAFGKEYIKRRKEKDFYENVTGKRASWKILEPTLMEAAFAFISKIADEVFSETVGDWIKRNNELTNIKKEMATILVKNIMITPYIQFADGIKSAHLLAGRTKKPVSTILPQELSKKFRDSLYQIFIKDMPAALNM